jgi:DNA-directed RNA polymerase specialized sigma24 family protein
VEKEKPRTNCAHRSWDLADSVVTPEPYYLRRREFLRVFGLGLATSALLPPAIRAEPAGLNDSLNPAFKLDVVTKLPQKVRDVFTMREMDDVPSKEICVILSITDSNVWVMLHRARMALWECLEMNWFDKPAGGRA